MGWNRPKTKKFYSDAKLHNGKRKVVLLLIIGFLISVSALWLILMTDVVRNQGIKNGDSCNIADVSKPPSKANILKATKRVAPSSAPQNNLPTNLLSGVTANTAHKPKVRLVKRKPRKGDTEWLFDNMAECELQRLLEIDPGDEILVPSDYRRFERDFLEAIKKPIVYIAGEDKDKFEKRRAVMEMRNELEKRLKNGEDIVKIMQETQAELVQLGEYKFQLKEQIRELKQDPKTSPQDLVDLIDAANEMLRKKGIVEMKCPPLWAYKAKQYLKEEGVTVK